MGYIYDILKKQQKEIQIVQKPEKNFSGRMAPLLKYPVKQEFFSDQWMIRDILILKENLDAIRIKQGKKIFAFSSARQGEGVTSVVANIAFFWAKSLSVVSGDLKIVKGRRILVIDANLEKPGLHTYFQIDDGLGLSDFLSGRVNLNLAVRKISGNNFFLMPAGELNNKIQLVFSTSKFSNLIKKLEDFFDVILIDTPPILNSPITIQIAKILKNYIIVIDAQNTHVSVVKRAMELLKFYNATTLGVVLNKRRFYVPENIYKKL